MKYTEGEKTLRHWQKHGEFPRPPRQYRIQTEGDLGNHVSDTIGKWYQGERKPRALQRPPVLYPKKPIRENVPTAALYGNNNNTEIRWDLIALAGLALLVLFGAAGYVWG